MESSKRNLEVDPDYELNESAIKRIKIKEHKDKEDTVNKIKDVINRHFNIELNNRQNQLEVIQQRINKKNCLLNTAEDIPCSSDEIPAIDPQSRVHPAVKKLLGIDPIDKFTYLTSRRNKSKKVVTDTVTEETSLETNISTDVPGVHDIINCETEDLQTPNLENTLISNTENNHHTQEVQTAATKSEICDSIRNRKKTKYRVVIGNISKWMPSESPEDNSTHKWMVYVRGAKDSPSVSHFIQKVVFYLHPSYKPNDIIELKNDPFHLSRKGWGEFPVRVQIFFRCKLNKPVDIIHNLKLDRTYTGRQTLGNETVVDLFLYDEQIKSETIQKTDMPNIKIESENDAFSMPSTSSLEHDYCTTQQDSDQNSSQETKHSEQLLIEQIWQDHSYCVINGVSGKTDTENTNTSDDDLIHGLPQDDCDELDTSEEVICDFTPGDNDCNRKNLQEYTLKESANGMVKIHTQNGKKILIVTKRNGPQQMLLKKKVCQKLSSNGISPSIKDLGKYEIKLPSHRFKNVLEALPFLFQRLPLVTRLADDINYKCRYPYATRTFEEYLTWNIGKQLSCEWRRAKTVQNLLMITKIYGYENWNIKSLIMYGRSHGYTVPCTYTIFKRNPQMLELLTKYETPTCRVPQIKISESDAHINVTDSDDDNCEEESEENSKLLNIVDENLRLECAYVRKIASNHRIKLKPEQVVPGVLFNAAERMIWESVKCLVNNLIRNARTHLVFKNDFREETSQIGVEEIMQTLEDRAEFQPILDKKMEMQYYW